MTRRLYPVEIEREDDGTTLLALSRRDVPLVSVSLSCPRLHWDDNPALASLVADLLGEGPEGTPPLEWHRELDRRAIAVQVDATPTRWVLRAEFLSDDLDDATLLLNRWLAEPGLPPSEWRRIVREHRAHAREEWAQPAYVIGPLSAVQTLGYGHPNAHPAVEKDHRRTRLEAARPLGRGALNRGAGVYATIGGDVDAAQGFEVLRTLLGALICEEAGLPPEPEPAPAAATVWVLDNPKVNQAFIALARPGVRAGDPERIALRLANYSLGGGGFASRLMASVRAAMGHTYGIHSHLSEAEALDAFTIQTFTQLANLRDMLDLIDRELAALVAEGFGERELADAQSHLYGNLPLRLTRPSAILGAAARGLAAGLSLDDLEAERDAYRAATLEQVNAAARRLIGDGAFRLALIGPARDILPQLDGRGEPAVFPFRSHPSRWQ